MKTILFLAANPKNSTPLRLDEEVREIHESLRRSNKRDQFNKLEQRWAVRTSDLRRALLDTEPQIVHFCGHGSGNQGLVIEDENGQSKLLSTEALAKTFKLCAEHVECVLLNACYSEVQAEVIVEHIDYVIGMSDAIGDTAAIEFATGFYDALGAGKSIETAYEWGCTAIQSENLPDYLKPKLKKKK
ncbi:CHAT domain-containing protein [Nostoc sp. CMAA1605]|nr:CHAT domain-containing protein [Nostoc sp. CMAA1605]